MIDKIADLRDIDDEIFDQFEKATEHFTWLINTNSIPKTSELYIIYIASTNTIKNAILDCADNQDIYTIKILFRSIIEHFLRFQYIWFQYIHGGKESSSLNYYTQLNLSEKLSYLKSINSVNRLNKEKGKTISEMWVELGKEDVRHSQYSIIDIENFSRNISIKNIIIFLEDRLSKGNGSYDGFLQTMILRYSTLSSFVHGGIYAHHNTISYGTSGKRNNDLIVISGLALQAATTVKSLSYLTFSEVKPEFGEIYSKTSEVIKKVKNT